MRILLVHNHYGYFATGGEANVMHAEAEVLRKHGHQVLQYERTNSEIEAWGPLRRFKLLRDVAWSRAAFCDVGRVIDDFAPDLMHLHNFWLILSPSVLAAARGRGVPTVLSLHNYRLICPGVLMLGPSGPCEICVGGSPWRVLWRRCYPGGSFLKSMLSLRLALSLRKSGFLASMVDAYIAMSEFARGKFMEAGINGDKIFVKPNFHLDPAEGSPPSEPGRGGLYVGRISPEKGVVQLVRSWHAVDYPLTVIGNGPDSEAARRAAPPQVRFLGEQTHPAVLKALSESAFLVFPSLAYETFGLTILEAMAAGRAVLASDLGPRRELVLDGRTGLLFKAGDAEDFKRKALLLIENPDLCRRLGMNGRREYLERYTPEKNYGELMAIYARAMGR